MSHDELDRLLEHDDEIVPTSGFAASVMDAIHREASAPPPIPFPWIRALPGIVGVAVALGAGIAAITTAPAIVLPPDADLPARAWPLVWLAAGAAATYAPIVLARTIGRRTR